MKSFIKAIKVYLILTLITGAIYPLVVTVMAQVFYPYQANGSLLEKNGKAIGSILIGQPFDTTVYFMSRPSATSYNTIPSGGSNFGLSSEKLRELFSIRKKHFLIINQLDSQTRIPSEMLFASASGLDPHITPQAAKLQIERIIKYRNFNSEQSELLKQLIKNQTEYPQFLLFGEERLNVLLLNLELDKIK